MFVNQSYLFILIILNLVTVSFDFYLAFTAPDEGEFCLTEILGNKIITVLSCPISLAIGFLFYSTLLILIYTKIRLHLATVCPSGPCIELPDLVLFQLIQLGAKCHGVTFIAKSREREESAWVLG